MCKRNCTDENEASMGWVRETPQIKNKRNQDGMCKRSNPDKKIKNK